MDDDLEHISDDNSKQTPPPPVVKVNRLSKKSITAIAATSISALMLVLMFGTIYYYNQRPTPGTSSKAATPLPVVTPPPTLIEIPPLPGHNRSTPQDINQNGVVAGYSVATISGIPRAFMWTPSGITDLGTLSAGANSAAYGINDNNEVVGISRSAGNPVDQAFIWKNGVMQHLQAQAPNSEAYAINNLGTSVGWHNNVLGSSPIATLWFSNGSSQDLGTLGGNFSRANDINQSGAVVGYSNLGTNNLYQRAFYWDSANGMINLGLSTTGGMDSYALALNNSGVVVGYDADYPMKPFKWTLATGKQLLPVLNSSAHTKANDINNSNYIVGTSDACRHVPGESIGCSRAIMWHSNNQLVG